MKKNLLINEIIKKIRKVTGNSKASLHEPVFWSDEKKKLIKLSKIGTIIMVPTHFTHLDSALIGWTISYLGLPAFMYGAGLVLYNMNIFAYFLNSLGAYKVDRRKKHLLYLETLKTYTKQAIINDCHNLFYPGGTRSRSGSIEENLKLGLLGSALDAQKELDNKNKKIFIVPVTFNYQFVLEAPALINQYISSNNPDKFYLENLGYSNSVKIITFLIKFFSKSNRISVSFGKPMDIFGNSVNKKGSIISLGGGGFINNKIRKKVLSECISVWLNVDLETIYARLKNSKKRPLVYKSNQNNIGKIFMERKKIYSLADHKINCDNLNLNQISNSIIKLYEEI